MGKKDVKLSSFTDYHFIKNLKASMRKLLELLKNSKELQKTRPICGNWLQLYKLETKNLKMKQKQLYFESHQKRKKYLRIN